MADLGEELARDADAAVAAMRDAALKARAAHARAELARHMAMTARNAGQRPRAEAVAWMVDHWLEAWRLDRKSCPHVAAMTALSEAFFDHVRAPGASTDAAVRAAFAALDRAYAAAGTTVADEMAWRSGCAHGWWADVAPAPGNRAKPFWDKGCPAHCL